MNRSHALVATLTVVSLTGCAASPDGQKPEGPVEFGHVHGLGINPADERLYVASHLGVFRQTDDGFELVADRQQDTMAFTVTGPDTFLASGHPDLRETDKPVHLGLIESTDSADSWQSLSLEGEADFHALEPAANRVYGYDSQAGVVKVTRDRQEWEDIAQLPVIDLAVDPDDPAGLLMTDGQGRLLRLVNSPDLEVVQNTPRLAFIDWPSRDLLVGVSADGAIHQSRKASPGRRSHRSAPHPKPSTSPPTSGTWPRQRDCSRPRTKGAPGHPWRTSPKVDSCETAASSVNIAAWR